MKKTSTTNRQVLARVNRAMMESYNKTEKQVLTEDGDTTLQDLLAPAKAALATLEKLKADGTIPEIPYEDLIMAEVLDTSEDDLDPKTGIEESAERKAARLEESAEDVKAFLAESPNGTLSDFRDWMATQGKELKSSDAQNFRKYSRRAADDGAAPTAEPIKSDPNYVPSAGLASMMEICNAGEDYIETAADTVAAKYKMIALKLKRVIAGKSLKNYYLLFGDAGIGKSYIVREWLDKMGFEDVPQIKGDIGRSRTDVAKFLWEYKDAELVVLDDCDSLIDKQATDKSVQNMMKGAMDPDGHTVTISPTILKNVNNLLSEEKLGKNNHLYEAEFDEDEDLEDFEREDDGMLDTEGAEITDTTWTFNARVIFISNLDTPQVNPAVLSRCDYFCLHLTQEEYLVRLGMIIGDMKFDTEKTGWTVESIDNAKALAVTMMANVIEAANHGVKLFGKVVRLTHPLEFRIVRDLVEGYLLLTEDYMEENPGASEDEAGKAILPEFVKTILLPKL